MPSPRLTPGILQRLIAAEATGIGEFEVQVLQIDPTKQAQGRYFVLISDSTHAVRAVTSSALHSRIAGLKRYQCIKLKPSSVTVATNCLTIMDFAVPYDQIAPTGMIGSPIDISDKLKSINPNAIAPAARPAPAAASSNSYPQAYSRSDSKTKSGSFAESTTTALAALDPYAGRFSVKVRVLFKSQLRDYNSATGSGKLFSLDLIDNERTTMRATAFRQVAERLYDRFHQGECYVIESPQLRAVKETKWSRGGGHELHLTQETTVKEVADDHTIPRDNFKFQRIAAIANLAEHAAVDVVGIVTRIDPPTQVMMKTKQKTTTKLVVTIRDDSGKAIEATIWGEQADAFPPNEEFQKGQIHSLSLGGAIVSGFDGRGLSTTASTRLVLDSTHPEAVQLRNWFAKLPPQVQGADVECLTTRGVIAPGEKRMWIQQVNDIRPDDGVTEYAVVRANIKFSAEERLQWYPGCTQMVQSPNASGQIVGRQCGKKMVPSAPHGGELMCGEGHIVPPQIRYNLSVTLTDHSGHTYATAFDDVAKMLLGGVDATAMAAMAERDVNKVRQKFEQCSGQNWTAKLRIRSQTRIAQTGETLRQIRKDILALNPLDYPKLQQQITAEYMEYKKQREVVQQVLGLAK